MKLPLDGAGRAELAEVLHDAIRQEYPHMLHQVLRGDASLRPPRELNPSFYGSYDWHSAVHCHWALTSLLARRDLPEVTTAAVIATLDKHFTTDRVQAEVEFFAGPEGRNSERPYGWAWLLLLHAELSHLATSRPYGVTGVELLPSHAARHAQALGPLFSHLRDQLEKYFRNTLAFPIRSGTHANSAFSLGLLIQAARRTAAPELVHAVTRAAKRWFLQGRLPWFSPPSGGDFLDPNLAIATLMAEILEPEEFAPWMHASGAGEATDWAELPVFRPAGEDPATVHLEGLLITKAWGLHRLQQVLPSDDPLAETVRRGLRLHLKSIEAIDPCGGFNRAHWIPSFVVYLDNQLRSAD